MSKLNKYYAILHHHGSLEGSIVIKEKRTRSGAELFVSDWCRNSSGYYTIEERFKVIV